MSKKLASDEINLLEIIEIIWKKYIILAFMLVSLCGAYIFQLYEKTSKINAVTELRPISVLHEAEYKIYNSIINKIKPYFIDQTLRNNLESVLNKNDESKLKNNFLRNFKPERLEITNIDKKFLLDLFVDYLSQKSNLIFMVKKFQLLKEEDYSTKIEYENAVSRLVSSIKLTNTENINFDKEIYPNIEYSSFDMENWDNFLKFIEKETNLEIQNNLISMFNNYISYAQAIKNFEIEDINTQLVVSKDSEEIDILNKRKDVLISNKYIDRMKQMFQASPIVSKDNFYAAKINSDSTRYEELQKKVSKDKLYIIFLILGTLFGIFFVLISNALQKRK